MVKAFLMALLFCVPAAAYKDNSFLVGVGYLSENALGKTTTSPNSSPGFLGAASYPLNFKYDWNMNFNWFASPQMTFTLFPRSSAGGSAKVTTLHFVLPFGTNLGTSAEWDWFVGPGLMRRTVEGKGGTTVLSNGTGTATFAMPGESSSSQTITFNTGTSYNWEDHRFALDLIIDGMMSGRKRSMSFMLSYGFRFGEGFRL